MRGKIISFEGCEGSGKTTKLKMLEGYLQERGTEYLFTREPGGAAVAEKIRALILDRENGAMTAECEALLYAAARAQLLREVIEPALAAGKLVVCDRYVHSSLAYQGEARGLGFDFIRKINAFAFENYPPDCTIFLDVPPEVGFSRKHGADENDRMEQAGAEFHNAVYRGYKKLAAEENNFISLDTTNMSKRESFEKVIEILKERGIL